VPAAATAAPPPAPPATPAVAGAATAIQGVTPEYVDKPDFNAARKEGWNVKASVGATAAFANNSNVVGQVDGSSFSFGLKMDGAADYNRGAHEWRNTIGVVASVTRTPVLDDFVKSSDNLGLESIYLYHVVPWFGPFVRVTFNTSMFRGSDVRPAPVDYVITKTDGSVVTLNADHLTLSDPFRPMTFKQSVGLFVQPYQSVPATIELRAGMGGQEVIADNQLALVPPPPAGAMGAPTNPNQVDVKQLSNVNQLGAELALSVWGSFADKKVTYKINADAMTPFAHPALPAGDTRGAFSLTNVQIDATMSFKMVEWASLDYQFKALRQPQVVDTFQVQNTLLLTFGLTFGNKPPPPPAPVCPPAPAPAAPPAPPPAAK
jgi:hypothetical protein